MLVPPGLVKTADEAVGINRIKDTGDHTKGLRAGELVKYVLQQHDTAKKPGRPHLDLRLGTPESGLYSWAIPKGALPEHGEKRLAPQTSLHNYGYGNFTGRIGKGYGKGTVTMADNGNAFITKVTPNTVSFTLAHTKNGRRYTLIKIPPEKRNSKQPQWLLISPTPKAPDTVGQKPVYKVIKADKLDDAINKASQIQAKIDGAHAIYHINDRGRMEVYSVRKSKSGDPIVHTERLDLHGLHLPELKNTVLRGEIAGHIDGSPADFNTISGFLNSTLLNSRMKYRNFKPANALFGVEKYKGREIRDPDEQRKILEALVPKLGDSFILPDKADTSDDKKRLLDAIRAGTHPQTAEGIVMHLDGQRAKYKIRPEITAYLKGTFPAKDGSRKRTVGGLTAALAKEDPGNLRIGTGFTDKQLADISAHLDQYLNKPIRVEHQGQFESGKLRAPAFKGFETDKTAQWVMPEFSSDFIQHIPGSPGVTKAFAESVRKQRIRDWLAQYSALRGSFKPNYGYVMPEPPKTQALSTQFMGNTIGPMKGNIYAQNTTQTG